jgi:hypothetical protein
MDIQLFLFTIIGKAAYLYVNMYQEPYIISFALLTLYFNMAEIVFANRLKPFCQISSMKTDRSNQEQLPL